MMVLSVSNSRVSTRKMKAIWYLWFGSYVDRERTLKSRKEFLLEQIIVPHLVPHFMKAIWYLWFGSYVDRYTTLKSRKEVLLEQIIVPHLVPHFMKAIWYLWFGSYVDRYTNTKVTERSPAGADNSASFSHTIPSFCETCKFIALLTTARYQAVP
jgi:hypothetical protein